jgi:hypothetical protein
MQFHGINIIIIIEVAGIFVSTLLLERINMRRKLPCLVPA